MNPAVLEAESNLQLHVPQELRGRRCAEPGGSRRETGWIQRSLRKRLRIDDRQIRRASIDDVPVAIVDDHEVERVEDVEAELEISIAAQANVPGNRQIDRRLR